MNDSKIKLFMDLAGQNYADKFNAEDQEKRKLGAQLLLSEVLEYVIKGLGVKPVFNGTEITDANGLDYLAGTKPDKVEMLDGLADVAYTMYWNSVAFGAPLEQAFELVCDNNLQKFVKLDNWSGKEGSIDSDQWDLGCDTVWPPEVTEVNVVQISENFYGVGKDKTGKVRKPSQYHSVDLQPLVANS